MSLPEVLLWQQLRGQACERWRKQHPAGPYVLDFYCDAARLCVEVDGEMHARGNAPVADARRDAWLLAQGVVTLRVPAAEVLNNLEGVLVGIGEAVAERRRKINGA
ncbi:endonuclease domain-containing protein [Sphingomonas sp. HT-1]